MIKEELLKLVEGIEDGGAVDEVLSQSDFAKSLVTSGLTLDAFKGKLKEPEFKSFVDSLKDTHFNTALKTWQENNLQKLIDDAVSKANPEETEEQKMIRELRERIDKSDKEKGHEVLKNKALQIATTDKLPSDLIDFFIGQDEETTLNNLEILKNSYTRDMAQLIDEKIKAGYKPPLGGGNPPVDESKMSDAEWFESKTK